MSKPATTPRPTTAAEALRQVRDVFGPGVMPLFAASDDGRTLGDARWDDPCAVLKSTEWERR